MQCCGFDPRLSLQSRGFFIGVNMGSYSSPPPPPPKKKNSFGWEHKLRSSLCTYAFHHTDLQDPDIHVLDGWMLVTKTHQVCTIHEDGMWLPLWLDFFFFFLNGHIRKNLTKKWWTPEIWLGTQKKKEGYRRRLGGKSTKNRGEVNGQVKVGDEKVLATRGQRLKTQTDKRRNKTVTW